MTLNVSVTGMAQIERRMQALGNDVATKVGQAANRAGAGHIAKEIAKAAPVGPDADGSDRTRKLRNGTQVTTKHTKLSKNVKVRKVRAQNGTVENQVTTGKAYHGMFVEFGSIHNQPQPFFETTFVREQQAAIDKIKDVLDKRLQRLGV